MQEQPAAPAVQGEAVRSPLVGTFYAAPGAGAKPYVEVGSTVKEGDILCIIEAMKVMNEIHAPRARRDQGNQGERWRHGSVR